MQTLRLHKHTEEWLFSKEAAIWLQGLWKILLLDNIRARPRHKPYALRVEKVHSVTYIKGYHAQNDGAVWGYYTNRVYY